MASDGLAACLKAYEPQQLVKGLYAEFIAPWLAVFPRDQFLFLRNEDYSAAPAEHMRTVVSFLGLSPLQQTAPDATNRCDDLTRHYHKPRV